VAHTLASSREIQEAAQQHPCELSPGYIYGNRRGCEFLEEGQRPREALANLKTYGVPYLRTIPYNETYPTMLKLLTPIELHDKEATLHKISAYARLYTVLDIKTALLGVGPVAVWYRLYPGFKQTPATGIVKEPKPGEVHTGNHMMLIVGWRKLGNKEYFICQNSWGDYFGDNGLCYISTSLYPWQEAWSCTDEIYPAKGVQVKKIRFCTDPKLSRSVEMDGIKFELQTDIRLYNDRILVPLKFFSEAMGCVVKWEEGPRRVTITSEGDGRVVVMTIGSRWYYVDGKPKYMDTEPILVDPGFTLVPLRFVAENLECEVLWDGGSGWATVLRK